MANITTTLHPENDSDTNLYPNIVSDNIPSKSVTKSKLSDEVNSLLNSIGTLVPSGTDTSTNILAYTENKGIYVATDNGHWYYWNGTQYTDGGVYQTAQGIVPDTRKVATLPLSSDIDTDDLNLQLFKNGLSGNNAIDCDIELRKYIFWNNGAVGSSGTYFQIFVIRNPKFKYIKAFVQNNDLALCAIGFFNSFNYGSDSYMQSDSVRISSTSTSGVYEVAKVPEGCQTIVVSSRNDNITPNIWVSDDYFSNFDVADTWLERSGTSNQFILKNMIPAGTWIKIQVNSYNFNEIKNVNMQTKINGAYIICDVIKINGVGSYYVKTTKDVYSFYVSDTSGNIVYDIYKVNRLWAKMPDDSVFTYPFLLVNKRSIEMIDVNNSFGFVNGVWVDYQNNAIISSDTTRLSTQKIGLSGGKAKITFTGSGFKYGIIQIGNLYTMRLYDSGWIDPSNTNPYEIEIDRGNDFVLTIAKTDNSAISYSDLINNSVSIKIESDDLLNNVCDYLFLKQKVNKLENESVNNAYLSLQKVQRPYYYSQKLSHLFIDKLDAGSGAIIPSQSIFDVSACARLGFKVVEGNVHATATSGKFIVMHGASGKIGGELYDPNSTDIQNVVIASTSFDTLRSYRYRSLYDKYKIPVSSLEEWLYECKKNNIVPLLNYVNDTELSIIKSIVGDNFIIDKMNATARSKFKGLGHVYSATYTKSQAISWCSSIGAPLTIFASDYTGYTDDQLKDLVSTIHSYGCMIGIVGAYTSEEQVQRCMLLGFDVDATQRSVNLFESGNLVNLNDGLTFSDFSHNGSVSNGVLTLAVGQNLTLQNSISSQFLTKVQLRILFNGTLSITLGGEYISNTSLTGNGKDEMIISTYILIGQPTLNLTATSETNILSLDYKVSKC